MSIKVGINVRDRFNPFMQDCISIFGKEHGLQVYYMYETCIRAPSRDEISIIGTKSDIRLAHMEQLLAKVTEEHFLDIVYRQIERYKERNKRFSSKYFTNWVLTSYSENKGGDTFFKKSERKSKVVKNINHSKIEKKLFDEDLSNSDFIVPEKYKRVRSDFEDDFFNWDYLCKCKTIIDPWTQKCQKCGKMLDWEPLM